MLVNTISLHGAYLLKSEYNKYKCEVAVSHRQDLTSFKLAFPVFVLWFEFSVICESRKMAIICCSSGSVYYTERKLKNIKWWRPRNEATSNLGHF